jgi:hypothetical protein
MRLIRRVLLVLLALIIILAIWLWWNRPQKVDMTAYVPADSLIYLEANDLPEIGSAIVSTDAWKSLAPAAGIKSDFGNIGWLTRLASWTGIGSADVVVLSRAQIAVTVLGFDAADAGDTLRIKPRYAVVIETHTGESRTQYAIEKRIGDFARRAYGEPRVEQKEVNDAKFTTWIAPDGERRIIAAVTGSVAIIGNDESAVEACLAVHRNERPSLKDNAQLKEMRGRVGGNDALAFGYVTPEGAARLLEIAATAYAGQISPDPRAQSAAASLLPTLTKKILGAAAWSAHLSHGAIEDRYFLGLQNDLASRLQIALATEPNPTSTASELLPADTYSLSSYSYHNPADAWHGFNTALTSQFDTLGAILIGRLLDASLRPYGIEEPDTFLRALGPVIVTARLTDSGSSAVTIVQVRDEKTLRDFVAKRLGAKPIKENVGDTLMLVSKDERQDAASFVNGHLLLGTAEGVRRCLQARMSKQTLADSDNFRRTAQLIDSSRHTNVITYTEDYNPARTFILAITAQRGVQVKPLNETELEDALKNLRYVATETELIDGGFERRTNSSFGMFGTLISQFVSSTNTTEKVKSKDEG